MDNMTHKTEIQGSNFKALVVYWSATGNTATVARMIEETSRACSETSGDVLIKKTWLKSGAMSIKL